MTLWKKVQGSQAERPEEWDTTSSSSTIYQRRNITRVEQTGPDGQKTSLWEYDERTMTESEMILVKQAEDLERANAALSENQLAIMDALADIYAVASMSGGDT